MARFRSGCLLAGASFAVLASLVSPSVAQETLTGIPALARTAARASGAMSVQETGPLERALVFTLSDAQTGKPLIDFEEEFTKELHVIAVDNALSTFLHEHAEQADAEGRFSVTMRFPKPGLYHVYADAVPSDMGQQVLRFDLPVGQPAAATASIQPQRADVLESSDGPYTVELIAPDLQAGKEAEMKLRILKGGRAAEDLAPYLGVAAHAVFIAASDLAYVHAHATAAQPEQPHGAGAHGGHGGHGATRDEERIAPELSVHVTPPAAGIYALWVQFIGGSEIRTVPFKLAVSEPGG